MTEGIHIKVGISIPILNNLIIKVFVSYNKYIVNYIKVYKNKHFYNYNKFK